jgi:hypothetical protein
MVESLAKYLLAAHRGDRPEEDLHLGERQTDTVETDRYCRDRQIL